MQTTKTLTVRVPLGIFEQVVTEAESARISVADYIRKSLSDCLAADHQADLLTGMEQRIVEKLGHLQQSIDQIGASHDHD
ncbi:hypothetical protein [Sulfuriferula sp. AH1]|uniref:hypothetical protein n=1 Tax=Sulfuriferula sp. AH1 TaxID=1985873 RepID=UPI0012FCB3F5|nr:hypothetical protein [Sulfuriferula sp. AH1]